MEKISLVLLFIILFSSCENFYTIIDTPEEYLQYLKDEAPSDWDAITCEVDVTPEWGNFRSVENVIYWVAFHIECKAEAPGEPYWQTPEETLCYMSGDCEDFCILVQHLCWQYLGVKVNMCVSKEHAWIEYEGVWWEPQKFRIVDPERWVNLDPMYDLILMFDYAETNYIARNMEVRI